MDPFTTYWLTTILLVITCLSIGIPVGYAIGLKEGVNMFLVDLEDDDEDVLDAEEVS